MVWGTCGEVASGNFPPNLAKKRRESLNFGNALDRINRTDSLVPL